MPLTKQIKESTQTAHQHLEKHVIQKLKAVANDNDYACLLSYFYAYFFPIEKTIARFLPDFMTGYFETRRNADAIAHDLRSLGFNNLDLPEVSLPVIDGDNKALGALYVLEGSIMGGPYIIKILQQKGIDKGFAFFSGYGNETQNRWNTFTDLLNTFIEHETDLQEIIDAANDTFSHFLATFQQNK